MLSPSLALLASIAAILILLRLKVHVGLAIFVGSLIISLTVMPLHSMPELMLDTLLDHQTLGLLAIIASALTLSRLMEVKGLLAKLSATLERIGPRLAMHLTPAVIGLVPMPAGALVSATALRDLVKRLGLTPEQATFINYWFRHIWEYSLPVYPAIITASVILSVPLSSVVTTLLPMTALAIVFGAISSYRILKLKKLPETKDRSTGSIAYNLLKASWPVLLLVLLVLLGVDAVIAFPLVLVLCAVQQKVKRPELKKALKYGLDPRMLLLLYAVMLYKATIEGSGTAYALISDMEGIGLPAVAILAALPLLMGFATGIATAFVGISFPLLLPFIIPGSELNSYALLLAYTSGEVGLLLSPVHLCFVLSAEYFKANLGKVYKYTVPPLLAIEAIVVVIYLIAA
jgi:integral membrane protein (TIGR00529 family)